MNAKTRTDPEPLVEFMRERAPWFRIAVVPSIDGNSRERTFDVVLRLDGCYAEDFAQQIGDELPAYFTRWLSQALDAAGIATAPAFRRFGLDPSNEPVEPVEPVEHSPASVANTKPPRWRHQHIDDHPDPPGRITR